MRLGGQVFSKYTDPKSWVDIIKRMGCRAALCPVSVDTDEATIKAYASIAKKNDIVIAEVGAWNNPLSKDEETRNKAVEHCKKSLELAERIDAVCCVNISGSRGEQWDGPAESNFSEETFQMVVDVVRDIIDNVNPKRTFYTLEPMPWMYPDSTDSYVRLIKAIDRKAFAVHLDPVNIICSPQIYFNNKTFLKDFFSKLGPYIKSCHAKDIILRSTLTVHLDEVRPGLGKLDYRTYLKEIAALGNDMPLIIEHLSNENDYKLAAEYIRSVAKNEKLTI